jgi:hypothetical protein
MNRGTMMRLLSIIPLMLLAFFATTAHATEPTGTDVSGTINVDSTWTKANSPYHVTGEVTVAEGSILTIEAGVNVLFDAPVGITVDGAIDVRGTETDSVRFVPGETTWTGIRVVGRDTSRFAYTAIRDADISRSEIRTSECGGISVTYSMLKMRHCVISGCSAPDTHGLYAEARSDVWLDTCSILNNGTMPGDAGAGIDVGKTKLWMRGCTIAGNGAENLGRGGGLSLSAGPGYLELDYGYSELTDCIIRGNRGRYGGGVSISGTKAVFTRCLIVENAVDTYGGGLRIVDARVTLVQCTVTDNRFTGELPLPPDPNDPFPMPPSDDGKGIGIMVWGLGAALTLENTIVQGNDYSDFFQDPQMPTIVTARYSNIPAEYTGEGNIDADPMFTDTLAGDYTLAPGSPCIDAGGAWVNDADGTRADMGYTGGGGTVAAVPRIQTSMILDFAAGDILELDISNAGGADLVIDSVVCPAGFRIVGTAPTLVTPGASASLSILFDGLYTTVDTLRVYDNDTWRSPEVMLLSGTSGTPLSGDLSQHPALRFGELRLDGSPYRVVDSVYIPAGGNIQIMSGVELIFDVDVPLIVEGSLLVTGSSWNPVTIAAKDSLSEWGGIRFLNADSSTILHANISGGNADEVGLARECGGGIYLNKTGLGMKGVTITGCKALYGGALVVTDSSNVTLDDCRIEDCTSLAISVEWSSNIEMDNCLVRNNTNMGMGPDVASVVGGLYVYYSTATLNDCYFSGNVADRNGGGAVRLEESSAIIKRCQFYSNEAVLGGALWLFGGTYDLENCIVGANTSTGNESAYGGGLLVEGETHATLTNCTIAGNTADVTGGGIYAHADKLINLSLRNCILWGNTPDQIYIKESAGVTPPISITYCNIEGGWPGIGNMDVDPDFIDAANRNYLLKPTSVCINAGDPALTDVEDGTRSDIGAKLASPYPVAVAEPAVETLPTALSLMNAPNPFNPITTIHYALPNASDVRIVIHNVMGQAVRTLVDSRVSAGRHEVIWDGRDMAGRSVGSGVYLYRLTTPGKTLVKRMLLVR